MLIFGFGPGKAQDMGEAAPVTCPNCHNNVFLHRVRTKKSVRLYFVPVVPYGTDEYLLCPVCSQGVQIDQQHLGVVERLQAATRNYRTRHITEAQYSAEVANLLPQLGIGGAAPPPPQPQPQPQPAATGSAAHARGTRSRARATARRDGGGVG